MPGAINLCHTTLEPKATTHVSDQGGVSPLRRGVEVGPPAPCGQDGEVSEMWGPVHGARGGQCRGSPFACGRAAAAFRFGRAPKRVAAAAPPPATGRGNASGRVQ